MARDASHHRSVRCAHSSRSGKRSANAGADELDGWAEAVSADTAFNPGFRLSKLDAGFLLLVIGVSPLLARFFVQLGVAAVFAAGHFFLFCNVLRATRVLELLWAAVLVGLWSSSYTWGIPAWLYTYGLRLSTTVAVIIVQVRLPSYHGAFWEVLNPKLPQWWAGQLERNA